MTTLDEQFPTTEKEHNTAKEFPQSAERRAARRHELDTQGIPVDRWDGGRRVGKPFGQIVDLSAGGIRIRTQHKNLKPDAQIRLRLELPDYAGISPFIDRTDVAGRLIDMDEMDRGMLSLYLSTQPMAA